jgi:two-component system, NtrC family, response regulator AtoC
LIVDDEPAIRLALGKALERLGHRVSACGDGSEAIAALDHTSFELVMTDLRMPIADGLAVLRKVRTVAAATPVIILTAHAAISDCVEAMREGAFNFLVKPYHLTELEAVVTEALASVGRPAAPVTLTGVSQPQAALIGESPALAAVLDLVARVAPTDATVLLSGDSGTGKEVVARLLHGFSNRGGKPFVAVNCGALPEGLVESELFGHTKGAFTGATESRPGRFVEADGGTLFLDEIGELPLPAQVKMLRVLQDRTVTPVGDTKVRTVSTRVVAATNQNLEARVEQGLFRADLFYRLNVVPIVLPALRDRRTDIPLLVRHFLGAANRRLGRQVAISEAALACLSLYEWPGNVRQLENLIERLVILDRTGTIDAQDLPATLVAPERTLAGQAAEALSRGAIDLGKTMAQIESMLIATALRLEDGNKSRAAERLGLNRTTLLDKLKRNE